MGEKTEIQLERIGLMPMPQEIFIQYNDNTVELHYIPISLMRGEKESTYTIDRTIHPDWTWANPKYQFTINRPKEDIKSIVIDISNLMADIDKSNNYYVAE